MGLLTDCDAIASLTDLVREHRCGRRRDPAAAEPVITALIVRRERLRLVLESVGNRSRAVLVLLGLRFAGPLSRSEIEWLLRRSPKPLDWENSPDDWDGNDADVVLDNLYHLGYTVAKAKGLRLGQGGAIVERTVFFLKENEQ